MTAARTKRTKTTVKAGPAAQWRGWVEAADWTTIGAAGSAAMRASDAAHPRWEGEPGLGVRLEELKAKQQQ